MVQTKSGCKEVVGQKDAGFKKMLGQHFGPKKCVSTKYGTKKVWVRKKSGSKIIPGQSLVKIRQVLAGMSYYTETRTDVVGTNVALSNVPKRVGK